MRNVRTIARKIVMKTLLWSFGLAAILCAQSFAQNNRVDWYIFDNGGGPSMVGNTAIVSAVGQSFVGVSISSGTVVSAGFLFYATRQTGTNVQDVGQVPLKYALFQNYPNPFNPSTTIEFTVPQREHVMLRLFDLLGREVATLVNEELHPGKYSVVFDAERLASGVYFYRLSAFSASGGSSFIQTKRMVLIK
jgi:hypothetical protein